MTLIGELSLWVALLMAAWAATVSFAGGALRRQDLARSGERAVYATLALLAIASIALWTALFARDFSLEYVASFTSANLPKVYTFAAFWAAQPGLLLLWCLILAACASIALRTGRAGDRELMPYVSGTLAVVLFFVLAALVLGANPFERLDWIPLEGRGMHPQLQNPGMLLYAPALYLGLAATAVPFAFAVAALLMRRLDAGWPAAVRRWALLAWFFNSIGIILGMWWAYTEPERAGYWAWSPVQNASLLPWLVNTAFLHSILVQEQRGMLRRWNVTLVVATFLLAIFAGLVTSSGITAGVSWFAQSPADTVIAILLAVAIAATAWLVSTRLRDLGTDARLESMLSREAAILCSNVVLAGMALSVLSGTLFPVLAEALRGARISIGPRFFNAVNVPLGLLLLLLTGIGPLLAWRRVSLSGLRRQLAVPAAAGVSVGTVILILGIGNIAALLTWAFAAFAVAAIGQEFQAGAGARRRMYGESAPAALARLLVRNRRRYGGYVVHAGLVLTFAAFAGLAFRQEYDLTLTPGGSREVVDPWGHRWNLVNQGLSQYDLLNRQVTAVTLEISRDGARAGVITSEQRQHVDSRGAPTFEPSTEAGIRGSFAQDVYVVFSGVPEGETVAIRVRFNPLVRWVWIGGGLLALGGLVVLWPSSEGGHARRGYSIPAQAGTPPMTGTELEGTPRELGIIAAAIRKDG